MSPPAIIDPAAAAAAAAAGYLLGSIPFGLLLTRLAGVGDIRKLGSGNIGATNVLRTGRRDLAFATLVLDGGKAALAYFLARWLAGHEIGLIAGTCAFIGHCFPVWLRFKGGKGVATFFGLLLAAAPLIGALAGVIWLAVAFTFRFSSLAALAAAALAPGLALYFKAGTGSALAAAVLAILIYWRHSANISRLVKGEEPKIGAKSAP
jgi:glycerol-3-phosphate acyltransferase PlsY